MPENFYFSRNCVPGLTDDVVLAHPGKVRATAEGQIKTDKFDSEILAHLIRTDLIPQVYASSRDIRAIKRVLRQRIMFTALNVHMISAHGFLSGTRPTF